MQFSLDAKRITATMARGDGGGEVMCAVFAAAGAKQALLLDLTEADADLRSLMTSTAAGMATVHDVVLAVKGVREEECLSLIAKHLTFENPS